MITVALTEGDLAQANVVGRRRNDEDDDAGLSKGGAFLGFDSSGYEQHILGVCGEIAFAKFLKIRYEPPPMKAVDVGGYEVRTASKAGYRLIVRPRDENSKKFASVVRLGPSSYGIQGWVTAGEAKQIGDLKNPPKGSNAGPAWFVPTHLLHKFEGDPAHGTAAEKPQARSNKWDTETLQNIAWWESGPKFIDAPFEVQPGCTVTDKTKYAAAITMDIAHGPTGPRARTGAIQAELANLRKLGS